MKKKSTRVEEEIIDLDYTAEIEFLNEQEESDHEQNESGSC